MVRSVSGGFLNSTDDISPKKLAGSLRLLPIINFRLIDL
jgi:hypothetical protein